MIHKSIYKMVALTVLGLLLVCGVAWGQTHPIGNTINGMPSGSGGAGSSAWSATTPNGATSSTSNLSEYVSAAPVYADTVTVTSVMQYFVTPDRNFNAAYYAPSFVPSATHLTSSYFNWTLTSGMGGITHRNSNTGIGGGVVSSPSSPWVNVNWTALGNATLSVTERGYVGTIGCEGNSTTIPVRVIMKPEIGFRPEPTPGTSDERFEIVECVSETALTATHTLEVPIRVRTETDEATVDIKYSVIFTPWGNLPPSTIGVGTPTSFGNVGVAVDSKTTSAGVKTIMGFLNHDVTNYGYYDIVITSITDRISRKCFYDDIGEILNETGAIPNFKSAFRMVVIPAPDAGRMFHVPN
jgi:hypothetical protein